MTARTRHLFVMDSLDKLNLAWDTSIKLAYLLTKKGPVDVYFCEMHDLSLSSHPTAVSVNAAKMLFGAAPASLTLGAKEVLDLSEFQLVQMRKEPPYDLSYVECLWILNIAKAQTTVWNDPLALLQTNEKLVITEFPEYAAPCMVGSDPRRLHQWAVKHCAGNIVVKPLNLFGGRGVVHLQSLESLEQDLYQETGGGKHLRLIQKFEPKIADGEVRAFAVSGKPISWCLKIPAKGDFLANTRAGSTLADYTPTAKEVECVSRVASTLMTRGIHVCGFDLIQGAISEVNITCPAILSPVRESLEGLDQVVELMMGHF
jgi:glutathione synthase